MRSPAVACLTAAALREPQIKAALIDELFAAGMIDEDAVVISEMPVAALPRRADLVLANGHLLGFEIKSDGDRTSRLTGQLEAYQKAFEGIVIVTGAKHLAECLSGTDPTIGVVAIDQMEGCVPKARIVRKPHVRKMSAETAIRQMRVNDLFHLTRSLDLNRQGARDRFTLEGLARGVPISDLRRAALNAIKRRYRQQFENFRVAKGLNCSTVDALRLLNRPSWNNNRPATPTSASSPPNADELQDILALTLNVRRRRAV